jgi:Fe(3+) dicitrate transport protein
VHRGFAPPQVQDQISNDGRSTDLGSEKSWNYELGSRASGLRGLDLQLTGFYMDFQNQIIPKSGAGGSGTLFTTARRSAHGGAEISGSADLNELLGHRTGIVLDWAYTWLPIAEFTEHQSSSFSSSVDVSGHRLTYAPDRTLTSSIRWSPVEAAAVRVEAVHIGEQYSDDLNTRVGTPSGRQGLIPASTIWNADARYDVLPWLTLNATAKNLRDEVYIQDRSRGILVGPPRLVQLGVRTRF